MQHYINKFMAESIKVKLHNKSVYSIKIKAFFQQSHNIVSYFCLLALFSTTTSLR